MTTRSSSEHGRALAQHTQPAPLGWRRSRWSGRARCSREPARRHRPAQVSVDPNEHRTHRTSHTTHVPSPSNSEPSSDIRHPTRPLPPSRSGDADATPRTAVADGPQVPPVPHPVVRAGHPRVRARRAGRDGRRRSSPEIPVRGRGGRGAVQGVQPRVRGATPRGPARARAPRTLPARPRATARGRGRPPGPTRRDVPGMVALYRCGVDGPAALRGAGAAGRGDTPRSKRRGAQVRGAPDRAGVQLPEPREG